MAVLIQEQLKKIGADVKIESADNPTVGQRAMGTHQFDAVMLSLTLDGAYSSLHSVYGTGGELNVGSYSSPMFDKQFDSAMAQTSLATARPHLRSAFETLVRDAPVVWIYEAKAGVVAHKRFQPALMRPDAWWAHLADWSVPPGERNDRDKIGLTALNR